MVSTDAADVATRLDDHHVPETNGRMSVCRRCGTLTDCPQGLHHKPAERQLAHCSDWLDAQARLRRIDLARAQRPT